MAKKQRPPAQVEIRFDKPESFQLVIENTTDGERVVREQTQREADQQHSEKQQQRLI